MMRTAEDRSYGELSLGSDSGWGDQDEPAKSWHAIGISQVVGPLRGPYDTSRKSNGSGRGQTEVEIVRRRSVDAARTAPRPTAHPVVVAFTDGIK